MKTPDILRPTQPRLAHRLLAGAASGSCWIRGNHRTLSGLQSGPASQPEDQRHDRNQQEDAEQDLRDGRGASGKPAKAENRCDDCDYEEDCCPVEHRDLLGPGCDGSPASIQQSACPHGQELITELQTDQRDAGQLGANGNRHEQYDGSSDCSHRQASRHQFMPVDKASLPPTASFLCPCCTHYRSQRESGFRTMLARLRDRAKSAGRPVSRR